MPSSFAQLRVKLSHAPLVAEYALCPWEPSLPDSEAALLEHLSCGCLCAVHQALDVDVEHDVEGLLIQLVLGLLTLDIDQEAGKVDACVVDDRIELAVLVNDCRDHGLDALFVCDIALCAENAVSLFAGLNGDVRDDGCCTGVLQGGDNVISDTGSAACDDNNFAFKI